MSSKNKPSPSTPDHPTSEPFTDPNPRSDGARQTAAKVVALPLAAVGGVVNEVARKAKELLTGHSTKIDTSHKSSSSSSSGSYSSTSSS